MKVRLLKSILLTLLLFVGSYLPAFAVVGLLKPQAAVAVPLTIGISLAAAMILILVLGHSRGGIRSYGFRWCEPRYLLWAIALALPVGLGLTYVTELFPVHDPLAGAHFRPWMTAVYFLAGAPLSEEIIFRGLLQTTLFQAVEADFGIASIRISVAAFAVAALFGLIHLNISLLTAVSAFALGLLAGVLRQRSGSLLPAYLVHAIFNVAGIVWTLR